MLSFQLERLKEILADNGIEADSTTIQGDNLEANFIKIEISEDTPERKFTSKGKKKKRERFKVNCIMPNSPFIQELATKLASERLTEIYLEFMKKIRNKKLMSDILGIEETSNDNILFKAFAEQYGELWLTTNEKEQELFQQFKQKAISVLDKYLEEEKAPRETEEEIK
ncbi:hypothetical protein [Desulfosporosinus fructosivorans]